MKSFQLFTPLEKVSLASVVLLATLASCKSDDKGNPTPQAAADTTCRIATVDEWSVSRWGTSDTIHKVVSYNAEGKVASVSSVAETTSFTYSGNNVFVSRPQGGRDTVMLNNDGLILQIRQYPWSELGLITTVRTDYLYSGKEVQRAVRTVVGTSHTDTTYYSWSDGNCVKIDNSPVYHYGDKIVPASGGDLPAFRDWLRCGGVVMSNKNLVSGLNGRSVSYKLDERGKVMQILDQFVSINGDSRFSRLSYECP